MSLRERSWYRCFCHLNKYFLWSSSQLLLHTHFILVYQPIFTELEVWTEKKANEAICGDQQRTTPLMVWRCSVNSVSALFLTSIFFSISFANSVCGLNHVRANHYNNTSKEICRKHKACTFCGRSHEPHSTLYFSVNNRQRYHDLSLRFIVHPGNVDNFSNFCCGNE